MIIKGRVVYCANDNYYLVKGYNIYKSKEFDNKWIKWITIPHNIIDKIFGVFPLYNRLMRKGVHHLLCNGENCLVITNKCSYLINNGRIYSAGKIIGSRPLIMTQHKESFLYGEYRSNLERSPVHIYKLDIKELKWRIIWEFLDVRHIHGVFSDPYTGSIWVTTGDNDDECGIWQTTDNFISLNKIKGGSQQLRTVQLIFTDNYIYFGSDAPNEQNYIYRMSRSQYQIEKLVAVNNSVFFGVKVKDNLFFSTAIEPSTYNKCKKAAIWHSSDGRNWGTFKETKKDIWSQKYFQYGLIFFPYSSEKLTELIYTPFAAKGHQYTYKVEI